MAIAFAPVFRLLTDFVCLLTYEFCLSLWKIARCSVILLLPLCITNIKVYLHAMVIGIYNRFLRGFQHRIATVKKTLGFPNQVERYGAKYENGVAYLLSYTVSVEKMWTQNTCIIHDV
jgi:hypothetical protein